MLARARARAVSKVKSDKQAPGVPLRPDGAEALFNLQHIDGNTWALSLKNPITQTGSSMVTTIVFPFYHTLLEIRLKHTNSAGVDATTSQSINLKLNYQGMAPTEYNIANTSTTDILIDYHQAPKSVPGGTQYIWTTNAPNTDYIKLQIVLAVLKL